MLALGAVIMLCAVAIIGAGYAAFAGTASTYNENNNATTGYMTLTPQATGAQTSIWDAIVGNAKSNFSTHVYQDSTNAKVAYYLSDAASNVTISGYDVVKAVGTKDFILLNEADPSINAIDIKVKAAAIDGSTPLAYGDAEFAYVLGIKIGNVEKFCVIGTSEMEFSNMNVTFTNNQATITATIYIAYAIDGYIESEYYIGAPAASSTGMTNPVGVNKSDTAPGNLAASFAFVAKEYVAPAQQGGGN